MKKKENENNFLPLEFINSKKYKIKTDRDSLNNSINLFYNSFNKNKPFFKPISKIIKL